MARPLSPRIPALIALAAVLALGFNCVAPPRRAVLGLAYPKGHDRIAELVQALADTMSGSWRHKVEIVRAALPDSQWGTNWASEVAMASELAALPGLAGVVGHGGSRASLLAAPIYNDAGIPQVVPTGTSRRLAAAGPWTFTLAPNDSVEGEFLGQYVAEQLGARKVLLFYTLDEYGGGLRDGAVASLRRRGVVILDAVPVDDKGRCGPGAFGNDYAEAVDAALIAGRPDLVLLATRSGEAACIVSHVHRRDSTISFVAGDGLVTGGEAYRRRMEGIKVRVAVAAFWHAERADLVSRDFVRAYTSRFGEAPTHDDAMVYDALLTMVHAVRSVGPQPRRVRQYLESLGRGRAALVGVTGPVTFPSPADRLVMLTVAGTPVLRASVP